MLKKLIPAYILSFVIAFTIFAYEPVILYASNKADLWFDFMTMLRPIAILFLGSFAVLALVFTAIKAVSKKDKVYNILLVISFIVFFASYIQGNYLLKNLPGLDGTKIEWNGFMVQNLITLVIWLVLVITYILTIKKFKFEKVINVSSKIALAVFIMLLVSSISTILTTRKMFMKKYPVFVTQENYGVFSKDKNFVIYVIDAADSRLFQNELEKSEYKDLFKNFTYYPDSMSYYLFTRESIPMILTGIPNYNEDEYYTYYNKAFDKSPLFDNLISKDYAINVYDHEFIWTSDKSKNVKNTKEVSNSIKLFHYTKCNLKYVAYKYLPYKFKKYAKIEDMNFNYSKNTEYEDSFSWDDIDNYKMIKNANITLENQKQFKFIHVNGAHPPYNIDENLKRVSEKDSNYKKELNASIKLLATYINTLKENGVYDNTAIVIIADHGCSGADTLLQKVNPILYIKGVHETHNEMSVSDAKVSHIDLMDAYKLLLDDKQGKDLFKNIPTNRVRKFIWYRFTKERHMVEYKLDGHAWESEKAVKTGKVYNR